MPFNSFRKQFFTRPHLWLIALIGVIVPRRLRANWRLEWEAELRHRERLLAEWDRLDWRNKLELLRRSASAFWDALVLQPQRWEDEMIQDLRYGARMLLKSPGFTLVVALSLALGIGANTVVFSLLDAVLLKTLPVKEPERLVLFRWLSGEKQIWRSMHWEGGNARDQATGLQAGTSFSYPAFEHFRANNQSLSETFAFRSVGVSVNIDGQAETVRGQLVSGNYFAGLGLPALLGRTLTSDDDRANADPAVVISYKYWQRRFGGDPAVVGKTIYAGYAGDTAFTIAGVTPPEFYGTSNVGSAADIWSSLALTPKILPQGFYPLNDPTNWWLNIMGRLKPGVSARQAQSELDLALRQQAAELQKSFRDQRDVPQLELGSGSQGLMQARRRFSEPLRVLMIIVGLVLAVACLNAANLLLARAAARRKEIAVRLAAGASRLRLVRQLMTESLLLAALGGALGLMFAYWGRDVLVALRPLAATLPDLKIDLRVLGFTTAVTILTGILFGLAPALRATKVDLTSALKDGAGQTGYSRSRLSKGVVVAQVAMSLVLLIGAGLFVRTLHNLMRIDLGFNRENLLLFSVSPGEIGYKGERLANLYQQLLERIEATPGVRSATVGGSMLTGHSQYSLCVPGYTPQPGENMGLANLSVGANFFETMEMPILRGRGVNRHDIEPLVRAIGTIQSAGGKPPKDFVAPRQVA
ncbi:MAG TPA: ABC transporter permease, partial [Blastocatellia bacterium]|nr:ABC transporter permease [Blastocatellia bacterium]